MELSTAVGRPRRQRGVTILEFIAFVGLAALVIAGALILYNAGSNGGRAKEFTTGLNSLALGARQAASSGTTQGVMPAALGAPASWQPVVNGWTYDGATISFVNNNNGSFNLQVASLRSADLARQLAAKQIFQVPGVMDGEAGVSWNNIRFQ